MCCAHFSHYFTNLFKLVQVTSRMIDNNPDLEIDLFVNYRYLIAKFNQGIA